MMFTCIRCKKEKHDTAFNRSNLTNRYYVCRDCHGNPKRHYLSKSVKIEYKIKRCLKCDEDFKSIDDYRLCDRCKKLNREILI